MAGTRRSAFKAFAEPGLAGVPRPIPTVTDGRPTFDPSLAQLRRRRRFVGEEVSEHKPFPLLGPYTFKALASR